MSDGRHNDNRVIDWVSIDNRTTIYRYSYYDCFKEKRALTRQAKISREMRTSKAVILKFVLDALTRPYVNKFRLALSSILACEAVVQ